MFDYEALDAWIRERLSEGEDETVYTFWREVMEKSQGADSFREASDAKMREYEEMVTSHKSEIDALKAKNYDLLMGASENGGTGDGEVIENNEDDGEIYHIDNLFVEDDEEK